MRTYCTAQGPYLTDCGDLKGKSRRGGCIQEASQVVGSGVKNPPANAGHAGDMGLIPGLGRSP